MTMTLVSTVTVGAGGAASIDFSSIPQTYTDLVVLLSSRSDATSGDVYIGFNGSTANFSGKELRGTGSAVVSGNSANDIARTNFSTTTASTFGSLQVYIPNYSSSANKSFSIDSVSENNATAAVQEIRAVAWANTAAITSLQITCNSTFSQYSTASLYTITKGSGGATVS